MALKLKVSDITFEECAEIITESIYVMEPEIKVNVEINAKTVTVESETSEESIKQVIVAAGYAGEGYRSDSSFSQKKFRL
ncbi:MULTISPECIES: copper chaperone [unclassified Nostoc]|uniref:heavy-metal-associated domain-containing protein n=1 Tax=unclassified Nostoc TaxID=2593658 RepID=UPI0025AA4D65|nr:MULTISPECIES: copper chaperone [unclassified Nostoc]MDM9584557.1 copper chaperone [Nostoc sp. GT001]MDZ7945228.1 copper chaperone [Nostoc sp. EfeVER01]MDZ7993187.1 copper chaperone [Nostoc sp. EspVER01]